MLLAAHRAWEAHLRLLQHTLLLMPVAHPHVTRLILSPASYQPCCAVSSILLQESWLQAALQGQQQQLPQAAAPSRPQTQQVRRQAQLHGGLMSHSWALRRPQQRVLLLLQLLLLHSRRSLVCYSSKGSTSNRVRRISQPSRQAG
jgi:hypothetical protein